MRACGRRWASAEVRVRAVYALPGTADTRGAVIAVQLTKVTVKAWRSKGQGKRGEKFTVKA